MFTKRSRRAVASSRRPKYVPSAEGLEGRLVLSFLPPVHYTAVGPNPNIPAVADFNVDGLPDIAVDNAEGATVSVLLGNGDGTFQTPVNYRTGARPYSLTAADINLDGLVDLVTADVGSRTVSVLLGNGDGTFQDPVSTPAGNNPEDAKVADFNGDGLPDVAVPQISGIGGVLILLGNGEGTFRTGPLYATGPLSAFMAVGDLNGDGLADLAVPNIGTPAVPGSVSVLMGNGDGTFQAAVNYAAGGGPLMVDVGDFNFDGTLDLAVANSTTPAGSVSVLLNNGDGTFGGPTSYPVGEVAESVVVSDVSADGILDLVVASDGAGVTVYLGAGDGTFFGRQDFAVQLVPAVGVGDFNLDGHPDVVAANFRSNTLSVLINDGNWPGAPVRSFYVYPGVATVTAGEPVDVIVLALNAANRLVTDYTGEVVFFSTDEEATTPGPYTFRTEDRGVAVFPGGATFRTPGQQVLVVIDTATFSVYGFAVFDVQAALVGGGAVGHPLDLFAGQNLDGRPADQPRPEPARVEPEVAVPTSADRATVESVVAVPAARVGDILEADLEAWLTALAPPDWRR